MNAMDLETRAYCPYCQGIMVYKSKYDVYVCASCSVSQQFSNGGTKTWMDFDLSKKQYSLLVNEAAETTDLYEWYTTNDDFILSEIVWHINKIIPNLTPLNVKNKISLYLTFS